MAQNTADAKAGPLLLTGFQGYGGRALNPAEETVRALGNTEVAGVAVHGEVLPVSYRDIEPRLRALIGTIKPRAVICLGLWPGEPMLRLERIGINLADFEIADNQGLLLKNTPIVADGPNAYLATLPLEAIQTRLLEAGVPTRISSTAGLFLCNATLYQALRCCAELTPSPSCGFIHLPYLPEQIAALVEQTGAAAQLELHQRGDLASMALETIVKGIRLAIEVTVSAQAG